MLTALQNKAMIASFRLPIKFPGEEAKKGSTGLGKMWYRIRDTLNASDTVTNDTSAIFPEENAECVTVTTVTNGECVTDLPTWRPSSVPLQRNQNRNFEQQGGGEHRHAICTT